MGWRLRGGGSWRLVRTEALQVQLYVRITKLWVQILAWVFVEGWEWHGGSICAKLEIIQTGLWSILTRKEGKIKQCLPATTRAGQKLKENSKSRFECKGSTPLDPVLFTRWGVSPCFCIAILDDKLWLAHSHEGSQQRGRSHIHKQAFLIPSYISAGFECNCRGFTQTGLWINLVHWSCACLYVCERE